MHLLLAAGVQAVKVLNNPALHVKVYNWSTPDPIARQTLKAAQDTLWYTKWGFIVACVAVVIATLAFFLTYIDVRNNAQQFREFMRRPDLTADVAIEIAPLDKEGKEPQYRGAWMGAYIKNIGQRAVRNYALEVLVPRSYLKRGWDTTNSRSIYAKDDYVAFTWLWDDKPFYPNANPHYRTHSFEFRTDTDDKPRVLWRIIDDYGTYPKTKPYGKVEIRVGN